jgi:hypothetical protein
MTFSCHPRLALGTATVVGSALLASVGSPQRRAIEPNAFAADLVYRDFSEYPADGSCRGGQDRVATLRLEGLSPGKPATVSLVLSSRLPRLVRVLTYAQGALGVFRTTSGPHWSRVTFEQIPGDDGSLRVQFDRGPLTEAPARPSYLRVGRVTVEQPGWPRHGWTGTGLYLFLGLLTGVCCYGLFGAGWGATTALGLFLALTVAARLMPLQMAVLLPWCALGLAAISAWWWGARALAGLPGFDQAGARWLAFGILLRVGFALGYEGADYGFHLHNIWRFRVGAVLTSVAPGASGRLAVPYPPLLYALPALLPRAWDEWTLRILLGLIEAVQPLLLWALVRAARGSDRTAAGAATILALMPEGILVIAKGIAANMLGGASTLAVMWAIAAGAQPVVFVGLLALGLLAHFGAAATLAFLIAVIGVVEARDGGIRALGARWGALALAGLVALAVYYGAVWPLVWGAVTDVGSATRGVGDAFGFHAIRLGKIVQDWILKFGGWVFLLPFAYRRAKEPRARLLRVWLTVGLALGVAVVFTPLLFRFEYFVMPAVAWAAALAVLELEQRGKVWVVTGLRVLSCALQVALIIGLATERFGIINAVMDSPRWPLFR